jgi:hypothetical protein
MKIDRKVGGVEMHLDTARTEEALRRAHIKLNMQIVADCEPLIPFRQGALRNSQSYPEGVDGDWIEYNTPYAHYVYAGEIYGPNIPIKDSEGNITGWFSPPGQKKKPTGRPLTYHTPGPADHFFDKAKEQRLQDWIGLVKSEVGKG